ncbi:MAG: hypothetical protein AAGF83_25185 [Cyanobacteria bacterium P01_G01_bin.67]
MSVVVKTLVSNSLKTKFRIICIKEEKTISKMVEELLEDLIQSEAEIPQDLDQSLDTPVVLKGYIPEELKRKFKVFCTVRKIPMNLALHYLILKRVDMDNQELG